MSFINCEVEPILDWSANCVIISTKNANQVPTFTIIEPNLNVPVVTLSTQDNSTLLPQLKNGFKRTITCNKYLIKPELLAQNANLNHLVEQSFQGVNRLFVLAFENVDQITSSKRYYTPNVEIKDYNVMIDGKNFFGQSVRNDKVTYENIRKVAIVAMDLSKQQALDADPRAIQQINFTANLDRSGNTRFYFILEEAFFYKF